MYIYIYIYIHTHTLHTHIYISGLARTPPPLAPVQRVSPVRYIADYPKYCPNP